jgi:DNA-binding MarR family transcriptional regulator
MDDRLLATGLAQEIEFLTARARAVGTARANAALAAVDLRVRSYSVLSLAASGESPSQRELAEFLSLDASQIVALVDELETRGLVVRTQDARDRRSKSITATASGARLAERASAIVRAAEAESLGALTVAERDQLRDLLRTAAFTG